MGLPSSVSGFHSLTESNQKLLLALRSQVTSMHSQPSPVELGRFSGYNAVGWVLQAELYFDFYAISNAHKLHYVSSYFDGDALEWFHWMSRNNQLVDWKTAPLLHQWGFWLILPGSFRLCQVCIYDAHANAFTKIFIVASARIHVEIDRNFEMCVSHKTPEFSKLNRNGQISLLDTLDNHVCENIAIACYVSMWHHQSILTCLQVSHNTLAYLAKIVSHYTHSNGSNSCDILIDLNLENLEDATMNHMCSILNGLKFPDHLMVQVRGSDLVRVESAKRISYGLNHKVNWKRSKNDMTYSTSIVDNTSSCDCNSSGMGNACLVIQDVNVVILHNLAVLEANWLNWLVDQMHRGIALAIGVSGQNFIWDANMDRDSNDNNTIFVLLYLNLEDKVLFEGQSNVTNLATMQDPRMNYLIRVML
ncbi:hypothetical protein R3W88_023815 [Solanum pinnatisectum]|uniref:Uncharacterized protein n=1 Tax=Solanum pinnatisectum TaxID=50273 RepID=A0AAV9M2D1_9SOLN|nr:hypothetical protein R3W88_023815 [Solanum pinnatisectum]